MPAAADDPRAPHGPRDERDRLAERDQRAVLAEHRRRVRVRAVASRVVLAIALVTLLALVRHRAWRPVIALDEVAWDIGRNAARPSIVLAATCLLVGARGLRLGHRLAWGGTVLESASVDAHLPLLGHVHLATSLLFEIGVYLIVIGLVLTVLTVLGAEVDRQAEADRRSGARRTGEGAG